jgi:hypothetical protein
MKIKQIVQTIWGLDDFPDSPAGPSLPFHYPTQPSKAVCAPDKFGFPFGCDACHPYKGAPCCCLGAFVDFLLNRRIYADANADMVD